MPRLNNFRKSVHSTRDEFYTPRILVYPILKVIQARFPNPTIYCPFDTPNSEFVLSAMEMGMNVHSTHIAYGQDFFGESGEVYDSIQACDVIVSNPPFTRKKEVFHKLKETGKPFAMLMGTPVINYQDFGEMIYNFQKDDFQLQMFIPDKKVSYDGNTSSFNTSYFCRDLFERDLNFFHLPHNNTGNNFMPSRMHVDADLIKERLSL